MPKKTRKEKIIADLRKRVKSNEVKLPSSTFHFQPQEIKKTQENESVIKTNHTQSESLYIYPIQLIKKDLTKTLILCILAISLEIALYLTSFK